MNTYCTLTNWARADKLEAERRQRKARALFNATADVVLDLVHPEQFNALPPSPRAIINKAQMLELLTSRESGVLRYDFL
jgi:hypothetical protein